MLHPADNRIGFVTLEPGLSADRSLGLRAGFRATEAASTPACRLLDRKLRVRIRSYVVQCAAATLAIFLVLLVLDGFKQTALIAALGASSFIAFTMPHVKSARPRYLVGGYLVGTAVGAAASLLALHALSLNLSASPEAIRIGFAAAATGLAIFTMVVTDTEHPPAAGLALGLVMNEWDLMTLAVVMLGILSIATIQRAFRSSMIDLL